MPHHGTTAGLVWLPAPPQTRIGRIAAALPAVLCWSVLIGCCVGILAILARPSEPRFDLLAPFVGHFTGFGIAAAAALWVERRRLVLLLLGMLATVAAHAAPLYWDTAMNAATPGTARAAAGDRAPLTGQPDAGLSQAGFPRAGLKVMAFNVWSQNTAPSEALAAIAASDADIVLLSELEGHVAEILKPLAALYPYRSACSVPVACKEVVLSRLPIAASGGTVATQGLPGLSWARIRLPDDTLVTAVAVHVHRPTLGWRRHTGQVEGLVRFLRNLETPIILGGDLNVTPLTDSFARIAGGAGLVSWSRHLPTWPAVGPLPPQFGIDHVLVTPDMEIRAAGVGDAAGSDHRPIWSRIGQRAPRPAPSPVAGWLESGGI